MEDPKLFGALLNGVFKRLFESNELITPTYLKEQVFQRSDTTVEEIARACDLVARLLRQCSVENYDPARLEGMLQKTQFSQVQQDCILKFWRNNKSKVHEKNVASCNWQSSLKGLAWRLDVKSKARHVENLNDVSAIVELTVGKSEALSTSEDPQTPSVVRFEMNKKQVEHVLERFNEIEQRLANLSQ